MTDPELASEFDLDVAELPDTVDRAAVSRMKTLAWVLDESVPVPGTDYKIGLDPILGVIPGSGDVASAALSLYVVAEATRLGVTYQTIVVMLANIAVDTGVGAVPILGDVFDAGWKANKRNVELVVEDLIDDGDAEDVVTIPVES